ncbi:MAG: zf-HC2 domain-containing protein [Betaproteobacteria bacterium]|nr:zf-HC2 domain-containing protein [Betaproteobacteria bacterium]MBA3774853.1 zf-HC2 domain-containing protein [Betaproteobacteria bacterium]
MRLPGTHRFARSISCKEASRLISQKIDSPLAFGRALRLRLHLMWCKACQRFEHQAKFLHAVMQKYRK